MPLGGPTGIGVFQAFNPSDDPDRADAAYRAIAQAVAGARGALRRATRAALIYPVVVLDAPLFTLSYDEDNTEQLNEWGWDRVLWSGVDALQPTAVDILTRLDLSGRAQVLHREFEEILKALPAGRDFRRPGAVGF